MPKNSESKINAKNGGNLVRILIIACALVIAAAAVTFFALRGNSANVITSEHYKLDAKTMGYWLYSYIEEKADENPSDISSLGLDITKALDKQEYATDYTYFEYFVYDMLIQAQDAVILAEAAIDDGMKITDDEYVEYDALIEKLEKSADEKNMKLSEYIEKTYGKGVSVKDIKTVWEIKTLSAKKHKAVSDSLVYDDETMEKYFEANKNTYLTCNVRYYTFTSGVTDDMTNEQKQSAYRKAKSDAEGFAACKSEKQINEYMLQYFSNIQKTDYLSIGYVLDETTENGKSVNNGNDFDQWVLDENRKVGDTFVLKESESVYTAYYLTATPYRHDYHLADVSVIMYMDITGNLEENTAKLREAYQAIKENGTEEYFDSYVYTNELSAEVTFQKIKDLKKNVSGVVEIDEWIFSDERQAGDIGYFEMRGSIYIVYYSAKGEIAWRKDVDDALFSADYAKIYDVMNENSGCKWSRDNTYKISPVLPVLLKEKLSLLFN